VTGGASWGTTLTTTGSGTIVALAANSTFTGSATFSSAPITISGNISSTAWLGNGIRIKEVPVTLTDTSSSGTVAAAFTDVSGGDTIIASSPTTYTNYYAKYGHVEVAGTNVTFIGNWAMGADNLHIGTSTPFTVSAAGAVSILGGETVQSGANLIIASGGTLTCASGSNCPVSAAPQYDLAYYPNSGSSNVVNGAAVVGVVIGSTSSAPTGITETDGDVLFGASGAWGKAVANATLVGLGSVTNDAQTKAAIVPNTTPTKGSIFVGNAGGTAYANFSVGTNAYVLTADSTQTNGVKWAAAGGGITALTGPVTASGSGSVASTITPTGVTAATYGSTTLSPVITIGADGRITAASNATISGGGGGASMASQLGDLQVTRTSTNVLTIGANCSAATPCNVAGYSILTTATATFTGGTAIGEAFIYVNAGSVIVGHNLTVSCSNCTQTSGVTAFPAGVIPVWTWTTSGTANTWDAAGGLDKRSFISNFTQIGGTGIVVTPIGNYSASVALDTAALPSIVANTGTSDPGCTLAGHIGKFWFNTTTSTTAVEVCTSVSGTVSWHTITIP
jgi:hypothetical protein